jgi:putative ABC transport system ATP-binding protein
VDLDLFEGEFVVLLGPSGSGKSTLLNILGGLDVPTAGTIRYRGQDLRAEDEALLTWYRRRHVGFVFQFYNLIPSLTARENVALITEIAANPMRPAAHVAMGHGHRCGAADADGPLPPLGRPAASAIRGARPPVGSLS